MRKSLGIATFFVVGAGAAGAGALDNIHMLGSDTVAEVTRDVLAACPLADPPPTGGTVGIIYDGTGSGNGEAAMRTAGTAPNPQQTIAPMSRFLSPGSAGNTCTVSSVGSGAWGSPATAEGLVFAMDGISVVAAKAAGGSTACNGAADDCDATTDPNAGLRSSGTIGAYTFTNWRDALRLIFAGFDNAAGSDITKRDCNSAARHQLVDNYANIFQTSCTTGACTTLQHAFIRDNESGTTDVFTALLGLPSVSLSLTAPTSPFCNALRAADPIPGTAGDTARYHPDFQDFDPIRRTCATTEQVCQKSNVTSATNRYGLGVVLAITPTDYLATVADAFPTELCASGNFTYAPFFPQALAPVVRRCPNGDVPAFSSNCQYPKGPTQGFKCLNTQLNRPAFVLNNAAVEGRAPSTADGRVYNLHLLKNPVPPAVDPSYEQDRRARRVVGAFYRIHTTNSIASPIVTCQNRDATSQIGCLVSASPCSIGYAGRGATDDNLGSADLKVNKLHPTVDCITSLTYPLSRKLYVNTFQGFADPDLQTQELELVKCFSQRSVIDPILTNRGFIPLPATAPGNAPYCEDFNDNQCASAGNTDACAANAAVGLPSANKTTCGNGTKEFGEMCDDGNNAAGDGCNANCQLEN